MWMGCQRHALAALPPGKTRYPLYRWLGRPHSRSGRVRKISLPPGFDPQTIQPVASSYNDCVIPALNRNEYQEYFLGGSWGKADRCVGMTTFHLRVPICLRSGSLNLLESSGPVQTCTGVALRFTYNMAFCHDRNVSVGVFSTTSNLSKTIKGSIVGNIGTFRYDCRQRHALYTMATLNATYFESFGLMHSQGNQLHCRLRRPSARHIIPIIHQYFPGRINTGAENDYMCCHCHLLGSHMKRRKFGNSGLAQT